MDIVYRLSLLALFALQSPVSPEDQARAQLEKAEELVRGGRYVEARAQYGRIAADFADTQAGREAALRTQASAFLGWADVVRHGPSRNRVDVVVMADGWELDHLKS